MKDLGGSWIVFLTPAMGVGLDRADAVQRAGGPGT